MSIVATALFVVGVCLVFLSYDLKRNVNKSAYYENRRNAKSPEKTFSGEIHDRFDQKRKSSVGNGLKVTKSNGKFKLIPQGRISDEAALNAINKL